jgi:hypothetical protein
MTVGGDGWTPGPATNALAKWLDGKLGAARPDWHLGAGDGDGLSSRSAKLARGQECRWWLQHWENFDRPGASADRNTLPRRRDDFSVLPEVELLKAPIFGDHPSGKRRREIALQIVQSWAADHIGICNHLSRVFAHEPVTQLLPIFSRLADAGMEAMRFTAAALGDKSRMALDDIASSPGAKRICVELCAAARAWEDRAAIQIRHIETAHRFAAAIQTATPVDCFRDVLRYHELYGGGLRWFVLRKGHVEPRLPPGGGASGYGFRFYPLCRLAAQCGVIRAMPASLHDADTTEAEE